MPAIRLCVANEEKRKAHSLNCVCVCVCEQAASERGE